MEQEAKTGAAGHISYDEFEPHCEWKREKDSDIIMIHLPEFGKEQLAVKVSQRGVVVVKPRVLTISGERTIDAKRKSKFYKEIDVPKNCDTKGIQAKFSSSLKILQVIMPKNLEHSYQRIALNIGMLAVVLAALVAFIVHMYKCTPIED